MVVRVLGSRQVLHTALKTPSYPGPYFWLVDSVLGMTQPKGYAQISHTLKLTYIMKLNVISRLFLAAKTVPGFCSKKLDQIWFQSFILLRVHFIQTGVPSPFSSREPSARPSAPS